MAPAWPPAPPLGRPPPEEAHDALDVPVKQLLRVGVPHRHHLREVDQRDFLGVVDLAVGGGGCGCMGSGGEGRQRAACAGTGLAPPPSSEYECTMRHLHKPTNLTTEITIARSSKA